LVFSSFIARSYAQFRETPAAAALAQTEGGLDCAADHRAERRARNRVLVLRILLHDDFLSTTTLLPCAGCSP
jgi:hypothetical protein